MASHNPSEAAARGNSPIKLTTLTKGNPPIRNITEEAGPCGTQSPTSPAEPTVLQQRGRVRRRWRGWEKKNESLSIGPSSSQKVPEHPPGPANDFTFFELPSPNAAGSMGRPKRRKNRRQPKDTEVPGDDATKSGNAGSTEDLKSLESLKSLENLKCLGNLKSLGNLKALRSLKHLENLKYLDNLKSLDNLKFLSPSTNSESSTAAKANLDTLPKELLQQIWTHSANPVLPYVCRTAYAALHDADATVQRDFYKALAPEVLVFTMSHKEGKQRLRKQHMTVALLSKILAVSELTQKELEDIYYPHWEKTWTELELRWTMQRDFPLALALSEDPERFKKFKQLQVMEHVSMYLRLRVPVGTKVPRALKESRHIQCWTEADVDNSDDELLQEGGVWLSRGQGNDVWVGRR